ncbi:MAG: hypothetical protein R6W89_03455, partial [Candidatus Hydrogenedentota bacterium]
MSIPQRVSLLASLDGLSRTAFNIARELSQNSRSGLTVRTLAKKLDLPETEIEFLVDVNDGLFYTDLTKVKLAPGGAGLVQRVEDGLENRGNVSSIRRAVKNLSSAAMRDLEERLGLGQIVQRKAVGDALVSVCYKHPDSIVNYVASYGFSETAQELFDIVWQSNEGVMPVSTLLALHEGSEQAAEEALWELFSSFALFEMFRFDSEDRLVRKAGLLAELRQWRQKKQAAEKEELRLKPIEPQEVTSVDCRGLALTRCLIRLVADMAAKPARVRTDRELWRQDQRRLTTLMDEAAQPNLGECVRMARWVGWIDDVDRELRAADLDRLLEMSWAERHRELFHCLTSLRTTAPLHLLTQLWEELEPGAWYAVTDFVRFALRYSAGDEQPVLRGSGSRYRYIYPSAGPGAERAISRSLEEVFHWLGVVDRAEAGGESVFRLSELGRWLLIGDADIEDAPMQADDDVELIVQPNFEVVVPNLAADPLVVVPLERFAERQGSGSAGVYRLTKDAFTRAMQAKEDPDQFLAFLVTFEILSVESRGLFAIQLKSFSFTGLISV